MKYYLPKTDVTSFTKELKFTQNGHVCSSGVELTVNEVDSEFSFNYKETDAKQSILNGVYSIFSHTKPT